MANTQRSPAQNRNATGGVTGQAPITTCWRSRVTCRCPGMQYLEDKQRAGVVELPPGSVQSVAGGGKRRGYLIPPSKTTCQAFGVDWDPQEMLLILIVPATDH